MLSSFSLAFVNQTFRFSNGCCIATKSPSFSLHLSASNTIKRLCLCLCLSVCLSVCHTHYSAVLSPFGKPEVSLEPYRRGHPIFQVSKNFTRVFTQFHAISRNFYAILAISAIFGPISTCWVSQSMCGSQEIHW